MFIFYLSLSLSVYACVCCLVLCVVWCHAQVRSVSQEARARQERVAPPQLVRELSQGIADRFAKMRSWEDTEHPVVLW